MSFKIAFSRNRNISKYQIPCTGFKENWWMRRWFYIISSNWCFLFFKIFSSASFSRLLDKLKLISVYTIYKIQSEILYLIHYADFLSIKCLQEFVMCLFSLEMNVQIDKRTLTPKRQHSFNHWRFTQNSREKGSLHTTKLFHIKFLLICLCTYSQICVWNETHLMWIVFIQGKTRWIFSPRD